MRMQHAVPSGQRVVHDLLNVVLAVALDEVDLVRPCRQRAVFFCLRQQVRDLGIGQHRVVVVLEMTLQQAEIRRVLDLERDSVHFEIPTGLIGVVGEAHDVTLINEAARHHPLGHRKARMPEFLQFPGFSDRD